MTKTEIKTLINGLIKREWVIFKDKSDAKYLLDVLKEDGLEEFFKEFENCEVESGESFIQELEDEFSNL